MRVITKNELCRVELQANVIEKFANVDSREIRILLIEHILDLDNHDKYQAIIDMLGRCINHNLMTLTSIYDMGAMAYVSAFENGNLKYYGNKNYIDNLFRKYTPILDNLQIGIK